MYQIYIFWWVTFSALELNQLKLTFSIFNHTVLHYKIDLIIQHWPSNCIHTHTPTHTIYTCWCSQTNITKSLWGLRLAADKKGHLEQFHDLNPNQTSFTACFIWAPGETVPPHILPWQPASHFRSVMPHYHLAGSHTLPPDNFTTDPGEK